MTTLQRVIVGVQEADFDVSEQLARLREGLPAIGAVACFVGTVRDINQHSAVQGMALEHYPGMTEKALHGIIQQAAQRFDLISALVIHRVGSLKPQDQIVLAACTSAHRHQAFLGCEFIMDYLKTEAPFWKKESTDSGARWVSARETDEQAKARWQNTPLKQPAAQ